MLFPKKTKYSKLFKLRGRYIQNDFSRKATIVQYGSCGLQALENGRLTPKHIEAVRRCITKKIAKQGRLWVGIFSDISVSKKPQEVRMGKGKGAFALWVSKIKKGRILFELVGVEPVLAKHALLIAIKKLPIRTKICYNKFSV